MLEGGDDDFLELAASHQKLRVRFGRSLDDSVQYRDSGRFGQVGQFRQALFLLGPAPRTGAHQDGRLLTIHHTMALGGLRQLGLQLRHEAPAIELQTVKRDGWPDCTGSSSRFGRSDMGKLDLAGVAVRVHAEAREEIEPEQRQIGHVFARKRLSPKLHLYQADTAQRSGAPAGFGERAEGLCPIATDDYLFHGTPARQQDAQGAPELHGQLRTGLRQLG